MASPFVMPAGETLIYATHSSALRSATSSIKVVKDHRVIECYAITAELVGDNILLKGYSVKKLGPDEKADDRLGGVDGQYTFECTGTILQCDIMTMCDIGEAIGQTTMQIAGFSPYRPTFGPR
jgi:hypothetical protein